MEPYFDGQDDGSEFERAEFDGAPFEGAEQQTPQRPQTPPAPAGFVAVPMLTQFNLKPDLYQAAYSMAVRDHEIDKLFNPPDYMI